MSNQPVACVADRTETGVSQTRVLETAAASAVTTPSPQVRAYWKMFGIIAVIAFHDRRVSVSRDIARPMRDGIAACWWVSPPVAALAIKERCEHEETDDIVSIAAGMRTALTSNADAIARAEAAIRRMNVLVDAAKQGGLMKQLNQRYSEERRRARQAGP